jgi:hypothetical protein
MIKWVLLALCLPRLVWYPSGASAHAIEEGNA